MLLLAAGRGLEAQDPDVPETAAGNIRELVCRGKPGIGLNVHSDSVPGLPGYVTMVLRYDRVNVTRTLVQSGLGNLSYGNSAKFIPGACNWGYGFIPEVPAEPGVVYFDLARDAQTHLDPASRDTSIEVAAHFPDIVSLPRYLSDSSRYWVFYVDDVSHVAASFGPWPPAGAYAEVGGALRDASPERSGAAVTARAVDGPLREDALAPDSAATSSDAVRASTSVDERLTTRASASSDVTAPVRDASTQRAGAAAASVGGERSGDDKSTAVGTIVRAPIRLVAVNTVLDRFTIEFSARPNASPSVRYSIEQPVRQGENGLWTFPGGVVQGSGAVEAGFAAEVAGGAASGFRATYTAWSRVAPERGKVYHYIITIPATSDQPAEQHVGQLTTVTQYARVVFTAYNLMRAWAFTQLNLSAGTGAPVELRPALGKYRLSDVSWTVADAPDQLELFVSGESWYSNPNDLGDQARASAVLAIGISPLERYFRIPFRMKSEPGWVWQLPSNEDPKPASVLAFEIEGYVEVTRR
jgi:hypothetical protein